jgi:hypothetical protein
MGRRNTRAKSSWGFQIPRSRENAGFLFWQRDLLARGNIRNNEIWRGRSSGGRVRLSETACARYSIIDWQILVQVLVSQLPHQRPLLWR